MDNEEQQEQERQKQQQKRISSTLPNHTHLFCLSRLGREEGKSRNCVSQTRGRLP